MNIQSHIHNESRSDTSHAQTRESHQSFDSWQWVQNMIHVRVTHGDRTWLMWDSRDSTRWMWLMRESHKSHVLFSGSHESRSILIWVTSCTHWHVSRSILTWVIFCTHWHKSNLRRWQRLKRYIKKTQETWRHKKENRLKRNTKKTPEKEEDPRKKKTQEITKTQERR